MDCPYTNIQLDSFPGLTRSWHDLLGGRHISVPKADKLVTFLDYSMLVYVVWSRKQACMYDVKQMKIFIYIAP